jgi:peptidyl-prolyl cis-trans isomerase SurA
MITPGSSPSHNRSVAALSGILIATIAGFALAVSEAAAAHMVDRIIAVVNTELITLSELKSEIEQDEKRLKSQYRGNELQRRLQQLEYAGLTRMIERKLQMQIAQKKGVEVTDEEIKRAAQELQRQGEKLDESSPEDQQHIREQLTLLKLVDREVRSGVMISETEMQRYFDSHMNRFALPAEYRLSQIMIVPRSSETAAEARKRAATVYEALKKGGDFADLALRFSDGAESTRGGNLGVVRQGELLPQIERAVAQLEPGQTSEPVETTQGWHIIRLEEKKPPQFRPFAEVKNEIQNLVYQQKTEDVYRIWMADLKNKSHIDVRF